ncbi:prenyltransferase/squalene oxidase repeat-containing protein [uncultured Streptomyces sp.]|uniref:prenyltransferase/squalene oxidase repeat-containing protein n=1 Tax=uncultured Streptomyces sp. TaxID=174707 RepID=UPI00261FD04E|nr:prenyltransferase/squalene oxidase repeat-containing protein [uncultured Streptomyces sp.]
MTVRRGAAALATLAVVLASAAPAVAASPSPSPSPSVTYPPDPVAGLYGTADPSGDGVWRQSLAFLAQKIEYVTPSELSVAWLRHQQCESGAFAAYRDPRVPCDASTVTDVRASAAAVQALAEIGGHTPATENGISWLSSVQNDDGGWGARPGEATDPASTALAVGAFARAGRKLADVTADSGRTPYQALRAFALPCGGTDGGAFTTRAASPAPDPAAPTASATSDAPPTVRTPDAKAPDAKAPDANVQGRDGNGTSAADPSATPEPTAASGEDDAARTADGAATAAAVLGAMGKGLAAGSSNSGSGTSCQDTDEPSPERLAQNGAHYLAGVVGRAHRVDGPAAGGTSDGPDFAATATAVVALAASGHKNEAAPAVDWLEKNARSWSERGGPAAVAQLVLVAHATGAQARDFGGVDLVAQLNATGPTPAATFAPSPTPTGPQPAAGSTGSSGFSVWWLVGAGLACGAGIGFMISTRRKDGAGRHSGTDGRAGGDDVRS